MGVALLVFVTLVASLILLGRKRYRFQPQPSTEVHTSWPVTALNPVSRQHLELQQGTLLSESRLEACKADYQRWLACGDLAQVETSLRPGLDYILRIRALTEIGSAAVGPLLEKQLTRELSNDPVEQGWYYVDLTRSLRALQYQASLPRLLEHAKRALPLPVGHVWAGELVFFPGFAESLAESQAPSGQSALRVLRHALEGIRLGAVPISVLAEAELGELLSRLATCPPRQCDPLLARVFLEGLRHLRRSEHAERFVTDDASLQDGLHWQYACMARVTDRLTNYLRRAAQDLPLELSRAEQSSQSDFLQLVDELRLDAGDALWRVLVHASPPLRQQIIHCLRWSRDPAIVPTFLAALRSEEPLEARSLRGWFRWTQTSLRRSELRNEGWPTSHAMQERLAMIRTLRYHPSTLTESGLLRLAQTDHEATRCAALGSLGWWEPVQRQEVVQLLREFRRHGSEECRWRALGALARLGEVAALAEWRLALTQLDKIRVRQVIHATVEEGLTWLWPDLDYLVDAEDLDIAFDACEALEQLREHTLGPFA